MPTRPEPVLVNGMFRPDRGALVDLLRGLDGGQWDLPTACEGWSVKDVALHVLGGDLGNIAGRRDGVWALQPGPGETMGAFIGRINHQWVEAARRMTPRLIVELLEWSGPRLFDHLEQLDPMGTSREVSWAAPGPAPVWLDVAREYTERWLHQQHIRDAVGVPGQRDARFLGPVIATFVHA
ncbi:MAG: maleylpyruvate isomerase family mycothiol-dependent enzyme, partial [Actinomycetota bacterium]